MSSSPPPTLVAQQVSERRAHILQVTRDYLARHGYAALTMRELARACRVSVPTLYRQFGGKQGLVREAVQAHFRSAILGEALGGSGLRGHARLLRILDLCGEDIQRKPEYYKQLVGVFVAETQPGDTEGPGVSTPINAELVVELSRALAQMQQDGELADWMDVELTAQRIASETMIAAIQWAMGLLGEGGYHAALVHATCLLLLGGVESDEVRAVLRARIEASCEAARFQRT